MTPANQLIQLPDTINSDPLCAAFWGFDKQPRHRSSGFVIIECAISDTKYLGQIVAPALNVNRDALMPTDPTSINQLEAIQSGRFEREVAVKEAFHFTIQLLREVRQDGSVRSIGRRPQTGATARAATADELIRYLGLPEAFDENCILGRLSETTIPVSIDESTLLHHILVSGTTGSGKSNAVGSIIWTAISLGAAVVIYDHKPDFQSIHEPNDEGNEGHFRGIDNSTYWRVGNHRLGNDDRQGRYRENSIQIPTSELDGALLARSLFPYHHESSQADTFEFLFDMHAEEATGQYSLDDFINWLPAHPKAAQERFDTNANNYVAMRSKLRRPKRRLSWMDNQPGRMFATIQEQSIFNLVDLIKPGSVTVIRIPSDAGGGRGYALFLNYMFQEIYRLKETGQVRCPVVNILEEAQELFPSTGGGDFQKIAGATLGSSIRKGRSMGIATVVSVQSADRVPMEILDNLNSHIVMRHTQPESVKTALPKVTSEQAAMALTFGSGEALVDIFGSNATVHCQLRRSPFKLTKFTKSGV